MLRPCSHRVDWRNSDRPSTIRGNPKRGIGILHNELHVGRMVWNRQRFLKDPDTGKRVAKPNPQSEWVISEVPELRIVDDGLWRAVQARYAGVQIQMVAGARNGRYLPLWRGAA